MQLKSWKRILFISLLFSLVFTPSIYSQLELPAPSGSYAVSRMLFRWVDRSRPEVFTEDPSDFREVPAMVWYPAEQGTGTREGYFPRLASVSEALVQSGEVEWWELFGLRYVRSDILLDAKPFKEQGPFPVVILSPGNGTNVEFYTSLASEIASHGYIVIGINHPHDVAAVELLNGTIAAYHKEQWLMDAKAHQAYTAERIKVRTGDMLYALEQLDSMNSTGPFAGTMDLSAVAAAGHSLGGITASEACKADIRFKACLNFDGLQKGGPFSMEESALPPQQPFLFLTKESQLHPRLLERFESLQEGYWVVVHGASHESFNDGPLLQPSLWPGPNQADRLMDSIQAYTLAFLDHTLKGQSSSLLSRTVEAEDVAVRVFSSQ
jgi:dienelactone hydrolase